MAAKATAQPIALQMKDRRYKRMTIQPMKSMRAWYEYALANLTELGFMQSIGVNDFATLKWNAPDRAPRMPLIEEFIKAATFTPDNIIAHVRDQWVKITPAIVHARVKLPHGSTMTRLPKKEWPEGRWADFSMAGPGDEGYTISKITRKELHPRVSAFTNGLNFKRRLTYINKETLALMCTVETLATRGKLWDWATWIYLPIRTNVEWL